MMKILPIAIFSLLGTLSIHSLLAGDAPRMIVEPSATRVSVAKASLKVSPLEHQQDVYAGHYQLDVMPFSFKNERGTLSLKADDAAVRKMQQGEAVDFTGVATDDKNGVTKMIKGHTTPEDKEHGKVRFAVTIERGEMIFNTTYRLVSK